MRHRTFARSILAAVAVFVVLNYLIWAHFTQGLLAQEGGGGDLARLGCVLGSKGDRTTSFTLPRRHVEIKDWRGQQIDVLTIGDSFSWGGGGGENPFYQDYIASVSRAGVVNVPPYEQDGAMLWSPADTLAVLYNSGYLDRLKPRYVLLESVERASVGRFALHFEFSKTDELAQVERYYRREIQVFGAPPRMTFINNGNLQFLLYNACYLFGDHAPRSEVSVRALDRPLFGADTGRRLLFYRDDVRNISLATERNIALLNENLNGLAELLARKGMRLVFLPAVDKYDVYSEFIVDNPYPRSTFFEQLRPLPRKYLFVDTKALLLEEVRKGEKDVFHADDTHWTWKASRKIFEAVTFE